MRFPSIRRRLCGWKGGIFLIKELPDVWGFAVGRRWNRRRGRYQGILCGWNRCSLELWARGLGGLQAK